MIPTKKKILLLVGSMSQTAQMHAISNHLKKFDCFIGEVFSDSPIINFVIKKTSFLKAITLSTQEKNEIALYCSTNDLQLDNGALKNDYDLVLCCSDVILSERFLYTKKIWIQESMIERLTIRSKIISYLKLPAWVCGDTALYGGADKCDIYCVASQGIKDQLACMGTPVDKIIVTGSPNLDHANEFIVNSFPHRDYVMVATAAIRENFKYENRISFIQKAVQIAQGRRLLFKLHPNELYSRAVLEIRKNTPTNTLIFQDGNTGEMIANCQELITQYSLAAYIGVHLGKKVHSFFNLNDLQKFIPIHNDGKSAQVIANVCHNYLNLHILSNQPFEIERKARISFLNEITASVIVTLLFKLQPILLLIYGN